MYKMKKMNNTKKTQLKFKGTILFVAGLAIVNLIIIVVMDVWPCKALMFFGNVVSIGLLFPSTLLYGDYKEKFNFKRYIYFAVMTMIVSGILMYLFVYRF